MANVPSTLAKMGVISIMANLLKSGDAKHWPKPFNLVCGMVAVLPKYSLNDRKPLIPGAL